MGSTADNNHEATMARLWAAMTDIEEVKNICRVPSISLGVLHDGEIIFTKSIGLRDVEQNLEANADTSYVMGSCSKMYTACALGILVDEKKLSWTDKIKTHLPKFDPIEDSRIGKEAAILDACRHSTGIASANCVFLGPRSTYVNKAEDHIAMINVLPTSNKSGQRFRNWWGYSNAAFGMLGLVVEAVSKLTFAEFLKKRMFEPLGLKQTLVTQADARSNSNIAYNYVLMDDGTWSKIENSMPCDNHAPLLASMGMRTSVNDMLAFFKAVLQRYDVDTGADLPPNMRSGDNPLRQIQSMWNWWWTRPTDDGFENDAAYTLGWSRMTMPTAALGLISSNNSGNDERKKADLKYIIGRESTPRKVYGHNGSFNGSKATGYVFPESHSAIAVFANGAGAGDAAEITSQILIQALFDLKPYVDLLPSIREKRDRCLRDCDKMIADWKKYRDVSKFTADSSDLVGTYIGTSTSRIDIVNKESGLAVVFGQQQASTCKLEPYSVDSLSFLPLSRDETFAAGMFDWSFWNQGIFDFVREDEENRTGPVIGFRWQWSEYNYPGLWVKMRPGMGSTEMDEVLEKYGRYKKENEQDANIDEDVTDNESNDTEDEEEVEEDVEEDESNVTEEGHDVEERNKPSQTR